MIDRLMRMIFELLVVLVLLRFGADLFLNLLHEGLHSAAAPQHMLPRLAADVITTLGTGLFCIGLAVRLQRGITGRDGRAGRERVAHERQARLAVRRRAEDVPVEGVREPPADPDPALNLGED